VIQGDTDESSGQWLVLGLGVETYSLRPIISAILVFLRHVSDDTKRLKYLYFLATGSKFWHADQI
jgi:hypothetical protein